MSTKRLKDTTYTRDQYALIAEFATTYGVDPEQIRFYSDDPRPFFDHEAAAVICRSIAGARGIKNKQVSSVHDDSISMEVEITFADGFSSSAIGVANIAETIDGKTMTEEQLKRLATSRATRGTLVNAGVDLLKLHFAALRGESKVVDQVTARANRIKLSNEAHALGTGAGLIHGKNKMAWTNMLVQRYNVTTSSELSDELLGDLVAFLKTIRAPQQRQAA